MKRKTNAQLIEELESTTKSYKYVWNELEDEKERFAQLQEIAKEEVQNLTNKNAVLAIKLQGFQESLENAHYGKKVAEATHNEVLAAYNELKNEK